MTQDFVKALPVDGALHTFTFIRLQNETGDFFQVMVKELAGRTHFFKMVFNDGIWEIIDIIKKPGWMSDLQAQLSQAILEHAFTFFK